MSVNKPLVILAYERLLPGSQLANRFRDTGYRIITVNDPAQLLDTASREMPLLVIADMKFEQNDVFAALSELRNNTQTNHLPIISIIPGGDKALEKQAVAAGATLVVNDNAILSHLKQILEQALRVD